MAKRVKVHQPEKPPAAPRQPSPGEQYLAQKLGVYVSNLELMMAMSINARAAEDEHAHEAVTSGRPDPQ